MEISVKLNVYKHSLGNFTECGQIQNDIKKDALFIERHEKCFYFLMQVPRLWLFLG